MTELMIGWTTAPDQNTAKMLSEGLVNTRLAACVQVNGPIMSHYMWNDQQEITQEYQLVVKFLELNGAAIEKWLDEHHPYDVPQWVAVKTHLASSKYLMWTQSVAPEQIE